jgi:hypothetical protein
MHTPSLRGNDVPLGFMRLPVEKNNHSGYRSFAIALSYINDTKAFSTNNATRHRVVHYYDELGACRPLQNLERQSRERAVCGIDNPFDLENGMKEEELMALMRSSDVYMVRIWKEVNETWQWHDVLNTDRPHETQQIILHMRYHADHFEALLPYRVTQSWCSQL